MKISYPEILPITAHRDEIVEALIQNDVVIVIGETGSGKSTQIPKMILEAMAQISTKGAERTFDRIVCTQPRRIAAVSIATWIAHECEVELGSEIGYKIRFDDETTLGTQINVVTDGILLQEMKGDPLISDYDAVLIDETHERNLNIDFLLGLLKEIQNKRVESGLSRLKIVLTSATFDATKFADFFEEINLDKKSKSQKIPVINVSGRTYPVEIFHSQVEASAGAALMAARMVESLMMQGEKGDFLIFMSGEAEIFQTMEILQKFKLENLVIIPLYSKLTIEDQEKVYAEFPGKIKVIIATNIAETSLTVPGVRIVVDPGTAKMTDFDFKSGIGSLEVRPISKASAIQRAGRAGRVAPGKCFRLYTEKDFQNREAYTKPEIQRSDLASVVLHMLLMGIKNLEEFAFIDQPEEKAFRNAIYTLVKLGAIDERRNLTKKGVKMAHLPLEPRISAMLLAAEKYNCVKQIAIIASSLSVKDPFLRPKEFEREADRAKRAFQMQANGIEKIEYKIMKVRRGRKVLTRQIPIKNRQSDLVKSDLLVFLLIWNRLQMIKTLDGRESFCRMNFLNFRGFEEIEKIYHQLLKTLSQFAGEEFAKYLSLDDEIDLRVSLENKEAILKAVTAGLVQNLCEKSYGNTYRTGQTEGVVIHPGSALFAGSPKYFVSAEIVGTSRIFARNNTMVKSEWIKEIAPQIILREAPIEKKNSKPKFVKKSGLKIKKRRKPKKK